LETPVVKRSLNLEKPRQVAESIKMRSSISSKYEVHEVNNFIVLDYR